jgi:hypothetical protein
MDLNYLFLRQQVERTRADEAESAEARTAHDQLARCYEYRISRATDGRIRFQHEETPSADRQQNER